MNEVEAVFKKRLRTLLKVLENRWIRGADQFFGSLVESESESFRETHLDLLNQYPLGRPVSKIPVLKEAIKLIKDSKDFLHFSAFFQLLDVLRAEGLDASFMPDEENEGEPLTFGDLFLNVKQHSGKLAKDTALQMRAMIETMESDPQLREAIWGRRRKLAECWPWPGNTLVGATLILLLTDTETEIIPSGELESLYPHDWKKDSDLSPQTYLAIRLIKDVTEEIRAGLHRAAIRLDAGEPHHNLLTGWRDLPKYPEKVKMKWVGSQTRIEIIQKGPLQLSLPLDPSENIHLAVIKALLNDELGGWFGLRNWATMQYLWSIKGGCRGIVQWTMDDHLEAMGYSPSERRRNVTRERVARIIEGFTNLELAIYDGKTLRLREPLIVARKLDRLVGKRWILEGMELVCNRLLYHGVRPEPDGKLGSNWYPVPLELAQIDHVRHPYAYSMGLILPIRWRLAWGENGRDHIRISGEKLLELAGVPLKTIKLRPDRAWEALERDLRELQRINLVGRWNWEGEPHTAAGICPIWPSEWMIDRTTRGLRPIELPPAEIPRTGTDLKQWRKDRKLTQEEVAEKLGVSRPTIARAEACPDDPIGDVLRKAFTLGRGR